MKSFYQYIQESRTGVMVKQFFTDKTSSIKGHHNPSHGQVKNALKKSKNGELRTLHYRDEKNHHTLMWDSHDATHDQVAKGEGLDKHPWERGIISQSGDDKALLHLAHNAKETKDTKGKYTYKSHPSDHKFMKNWRHHRTYKDHKLKEISGHTHSSEYSTDLEQ